MNATRREPHTLVAAALILGVSLAFRLIVLPGSTPANMDPDAAHFLNIARCFERGQGFSNVGAWPAWMKPERLPMPETFKEPGYPWLIWKLKPLTGGDPFRAGQLISLLGGLALPLLTFGLARSVTRDRGASLVAGLLAAASPLLIAQSVRMMVDSIFPATAIASLALLAWRPGGEDRPRPILLDAAAGLMLGTAFLLRGGALMLALPIGVLAFTRQTPRRAGLGLALVFASAAVVASPFILRNLRLFHVWYYSDVGAYGIWPYVDQLSFNAGLDRPPAPILFALTHLPQVARHWLESAARFTLHTFEEEVLGHQWLLPLAAGLVLGLRQRRELAFAYLYVFAATAFIFAVHWDSRYFVSITAVMCVFAGVGTAWIWRRLGDEPAWGRFTMKPLLVSLFALALLTQLNVARLEVSRQPPPENGAATALASEIHDRLGPDESVMVMTTSSYAWFADRHTVHLVISDTPRFLATLRRLNVRMAVLPTTRLAEFAARYEDGRLPAALVFEREDPKLGVTIFRVDAERANTPY